MPWNSKNTPAELLGNTKDLAKALNVATAALCAEMIGGMQRELELTVAYAKTRKQFGKPIGIFQAVQHLCADMYLETESSRSATYYAAWALEENVPDAAASVSVAKMYASDASRNGGQSRYTGPRWNGFHLGERSSSLLPSRQGLRDHAGRCSIPS